MCISHDVIYGVFSHDILIELLPFLFTCGCCLQPVKDLSFPVLFKDLILKLRKDKRSTDSHRVIVGSYLQTTTKYWSSEND